NRPNLVYAVIPMIQSMDNFSNLDFLIPVPCPSDFILPKTILFIDNKLKAQRLAKYLNDKLPPALAETKPFRHYYSSMSRAYLEHTVNGFKDGT
ncbi:hypothetical protein B0H13DRAFT_1450143, partial [Mycena leptocephala]